jgi:vacuolar-type H+-ATPase subunit H
LNSDSLAKEKTTVAHAETSHFGTTSLSAVERIVAALSELENDIDGLYTRTEEMKRRIMAHSNEEIEKLRQQVIALANEDAKQIVNDAKAEADAESEKIAESGRVSIANIKKNINSSFDRAVDNIVKTVLGDTSLSSPTYTQQKTELKASSSSANPKIKKYTSDGKPVVS